MKIGNDSVVMGNVPQNLEVGEGSVVIGPTDANGNTILNRPMAIGRNAQAGPTSIAIGAGANAGSDFNLAAAIHELLSLAKQSHNAQAQSHLGAIADELTKPDPDKSLIHRSWEALKVAGTIDGAYSLLSAITSFLSKWN